jgi:uncharacterized membrane protein YphA (DoxX/SURF4 family)
MSADYDRVAEVFEDMGTYLHRLKVFEHRVPPVQEVKVVITEVLATILVLCGICTKYIQTKRMGMRSYYQLFPLGVRDRGIPLQTR